MSRMSKRHNAPTTEAVCRNVRCSDSKRGETDDELVARLLSEACETLEQVSASVAELNNKLDSMQRRIETGELRRQVEAEMRRWLAKDDDFATKVRAYERSRSKLRSAYRDLAK